MLSLSSPLPRTRGESAGFIPVVPGREGDARQLGRGFYWDIEIKIANRFDRLADVLLKSAADLQTEIRISNEEVADILVFAVQHSEGNAALVQVVH